jgi:hypothetical protein
MLKTLWALDKQVWGRMDVLLLRASFLRVRK